MLIVFLPTKFQTSSVPLVDFRQEGGVILPQKHYHLNQTIPYTLLKLGKIADQELRTYIQLILVTFLLFYFT